MRIYTLTEGVPRLRGFDEQVRLSKSRDDFYLETKERVMKIPTRK